MSNNPIKKIIINEKITKNMGFEEVCKQFNPIIKKIAMQWTCFGYDDIYQVATIGLWKAFSNYDSNKNTSFGYFASIIANREVFLYVRNFCKNNMQTISLNNTIYTDKAYSNKIEFEDCIESDVEESDQVIDKLIIKEVLNTVSQKEKRIFVKYFLLGYTQREIAKEENTSQANISKLKNRIQIKLANKYTSMLA